MGTFVKSLVAPFEISKLRLQAMHEMVSEKSLSRPYTGTFNVIQRIVQLEGPKGLFKGNMTNIIRYAPNQALTLSLKDLYRDLIMGGTGGRGRSAVLGNILCSGFAAVTSQIFLYSLDLARTKLSNDRSSKKRKKQYRNLVDVYRQTIRQEGVAGLYRGFFVGCTVYFIYRALTIGTYDSFKHNFDSLSKKYAFNYCVMFVVSTMLFPLDTLRRTMIMMNTSKKRVFRNSLQCFRYIVQNNGYRHFYSGLFPNIIKTSFSSLVLVLYDMIKTKLNNHSH